VRSTMAMKTFWVAVVVVTLGAAARADEKPAAEAARKEQTPPAPPKAEQAVTQHRIVIDGTPIDYTATAGTLIVRNEKDEPYASMGYIAYV
jgi:carboxypeptidase C (cathepsin A)